MIGRIKAWVLGSPPEPTPLPRLGSVCEACGYAPGALGPVEGRPPMHPRCRDEYETTYRLWRAGLLDPEEPVNPEEGF